ncbi:MAG TPA: tyrosine-type recombinase/integrase [Thermoanaerobaculia bacterium]|nr:tyrosine-type recombinase/integrase [Thermoanaerobaculia bacterium]
MPSPPKNASAFNDRALRALRPGRIRVDYMDLGLRGFGLTVRPSGTKTFFVRYRAGRLEGRITLGDYPALTLASARTMARDVIGRLARGEDPQADRRAQRDAPTFGEVAADYLELHAKRRKRTWQEDERILRRDLLPAWRHLPAAAIRRRDVANLLDRVVGRGSPIMANRIRALASKIFAFALEREIVEFNPVAGLPPQGEERGRERVLSEDEIRTLWQAWEAEGSIASFIFRLLLLTAQREAELLGMRWTDIAGAWWTVPAGIVKNKLAHRVYLGSEARELLAELKERTGDGPWVFASPRRKGAPTASINKAKERFRATSGIPDWRPHDLRRTAATYMGRLGVPRPAIARVLNHVDAGVTAIYDRSTAEPAIEQALRLWGNRLDEIVNGQSRPATSTSPG